MSGGASAAQAIDANDRDDNSVSQARHAPARAEAFTYIRCRIGRLGRIEPLQGSDASRTTRGNCVTVSIRRQNPSSNPQRVGNVWAKCLGIDGRVLTHSSEDQCARALERL